MPDDSLYVVVAPKCYSYSCMLEYVCYFPYLWGVVHECDPFFVVFWFLVCFVLFYAVFEFFDYVNRKVVVMGNSAYDVPFFPFVFYVHGECYHPVL